MALEHAAEDQVAQGALDGVGQERIAPHGAEALHPGAAAAREDVERQREAVVLGGVPERLPRRVGVRPVLRRDAPDEPALQPEASGPLDLGHRRRHVVHRHERHAGEATGGVRAVLGQPVVVRLEQRRAQAAVVDAVEHHPVARVEDLAGDAVDVLVLRPLGAVVGAARHAGVALVHRLLVAPRIAPGDGEPRHRHGPQVLAHEVVAGDAVDLAHHLRRPVPVRLGGAVGPDVGRLDDVGVGGEQAVDRHRDLRGRRPVRVPADPPRDCSGTLPAATGT